MSGREERVGVGVRGGAKEEGRADSTLSTEPSAGLDLRTLRYSLSRNQELDV